MKKSLITLAIVLLAMAGRAQIKVHDDNWVSIGCLNGSFGLQVTPSGYTYSRTQISDSYSWALVYCQSLRTEALDCRESLQFRLRMLQEAHVLCLW